LIPGTIFSAIHFGGLGGAVCWLIITIIYLFINPAMIHRLFLKGEAFNWYWNDTFKPVIGCIVIFFLSRFFLSQNQFNISEKIGVLMITGILGFISTLLSLSELKNNLIKKLGLQLRTK
jgi:hypothetical protein